MRLCTRTALALSLLAWAAGEAEARAPVKPPEPIKVPEKVKEDLGERAVAILSGATRVEVFRLDGERVKPAPPKTIGSDRLQWTITKTGKEKGKEFAAKVRAVVFDEATRLPTGASGFPSGDVAFRAWKGKESVTVIVDFERFGLRVVARDADGKQLKEASGGFLFKAKGVFDDGTLFARVKALAVEAFPDDKQFKAMDPYKPRKK